MPRHLVPRLAFRPVVTHPAERPLQVRPWGDFRAAVAGAQRVIGEFGIGDAGWMRRTAAEEPDTLFLGVEAVPRYFNKCCRRVAEENLNNVWLAFGDARLAVLPDCVPAGSLDMAVYLFPDPWTKARHNKRRMLAPANAPFVARTLKTGGILRVRTDIPDYIREAEENFPPLGFELVARRTNDDPAAAITRWERKKIDEGFGITEVELRKTRPLSADEDPGDRLPMDPRGTADHEPEVLRHAGFDVAPAPDTAEQMDR